MKPAYRFEKLRFGPLPKDAMISPRVAPPVIGVGLLEAIPEADLLKRADPDDRDGDGVSGRPNRVWSVEAKRRELGRFGWKANQPTVSQQNAGAFLGDMGVTSRAFPVQNCPEDAVDCRTAPRGRKLDLDDQDRRNMDVYVRLLAVPARRDVNDPAAAFRAAQCQSCHVESHRTGVVPGFPELSKQLIFPFTDLLLHDMGGGLADGRPDFEATGSEWRTPPLWGIGLTQEVGGHTRFLHDGRARSLEEAILWHGGEAEAARARFMALSRDERAALIKFLETL
jgi:CxxC motif-containing protein (DUF1111 family)